MWKCLKIIGTELLLKVSVIVLLQTTVQGLKFSYGSCPSIEPMADIYLKRYMGVWHQFASIRPVWKIFSKCVKFHYTMGSNGEFFIESSHKTLSNDITKTNFGIAKPEEYHGLPQEAGFNMHYFNWFRNKTAVTTPLYILNTDYENYAVEYSCTEVTWFTLQRLQVLVRNLEVNPTFVLDYTLNTLEAEEIGHMFHYLQTTNQNNC
uniref:Lipocalin/cytosolic fatty-acid binding domain-containing protein n=1 Tax=Clastoptera arizonana TaxID=38151 RepID=A0A1B6D0K8_9HEMI